MDIFNEIKAGQEDIERVADCIRTYVKAGLLDDEAYGRLLETVGDYNDDMCIPLAIYLGTI